MLTPIMRPILQPVMVPVDYEYGDVFNPLSLFAGGKKGYTYDFLDRSTLFQDTAGTIPALAIGDPVALVLDKSGNGNHLVQTTATKRALVSADGLYFDGIDDCFVTVGEVDTGGSESVAVFYGGVYESSSSNTFQFLVETGVAAGSLTGAFYAAENSAVNTYRPRTYIKGTSDSATTWLTVDTPPQRKVSVSQMRLTSGNTLNKYIRNGVLVGQIFPSLGDTVAFGNYIHHIGARNQNQYFYKGTMTAISCVYKECTDTEVKAMSQFINNRMGGVY